MMAMNRERFMAEKALAEIPNDKRHDERFLTLAKYVLENDLAAEEALYRRRASRVHK
jgi:hypothetical protein